jgi:hypothetical protein
MGNANHLADRRKEDPIPGACPVPFKKPTSSEINAIVTTLNRFIKYKAISFAWPFLVIELQESPEYESKSLPGKIGGWTAQYHQNSDSYWSEKTPLGRTRLMTPTRLPKGDEHDYTEGGDGILGPGVRVEGKSTSSTAGVLVRNIKGEKRVIVCHHGFAEANDEDVWHPNGNGVVLGRIKERFVDDDVALVELGPDIRFQNDQQFDCKTPKRLLPHDEMKLGDCFFVDGMTTGGVALIFYGNRLVEGYPNSFSFLRYDTENIFKGIGPIGTSILRAGMCGAAIVNDGDGGVAGFFRFDAGDGDVLSPTLDKLIDAGWEVCDEA